MCPGYSPSQVPNIRREGNINQSNCKKKKQLLPSSIATLILTLNLHMHSTNMVNISSALGPTSMISLASQSILMKISYKRVDYGIPLKDQKSSLETTWSLLSTVNYAKKKRTTHLINKSLTNTAHILYSKHEQVNIKNLLLTNHWPTSWLT